jgi:hypothetical protein
MFIYNIPSWTLSTYAVLYIRMHMLRVYYTQLFINNIIYMNMTQYYINKYDTQGLNIFTGIYKYIYICIYILNFPLYLNIETL